MLEIWKIGECHPKDKSGRSEVNCKIPPEHWLQWKAMISPTSSQPKQQQNLTKCQNRIAIYLKRKKAMTMTITSWGILSEDGLLRLQEQRRQPVWHSKEEADIWDKPLIGNPSQSKTMGGSHCCPVVTLQFLTKENQTFPAGFLRKADHRECEDPSGCKQQPSEKCGQREKTKTSLETWEDDYCSLLLLLLLLLLFIIVREKSKTSLETWEDHSCSYFLLMFLKCS